MLWYVSYYFDPVRFFTSFIPFGYYYMLFVFISWYWLLVFIFNIIDFCFLIVTGFLILFLVSCCWLFCLIVLS